MSAKRDRLTVLALDFGTSSLKAGLINTDGELLWKERKPYSANLRSTMPWISCLREIGTELAEIFPRSPSSTPADKILAIPSSIIISGNGPSPVLLEGGYRVGDRDRPSQVLLWNTKGEIAIAGEMSVYLPKLNYFRQSYPDAFGNIEGIMTCPDYLVWLLTGREVTTSQSTEFSQYLWTENSLQIYGFSKLFFPPIAPPGTLIGELDSFGSEILGLPEGIPVMNGGTDFLMSLIGTACLEEGLCCDRAGTSEGINFCSQKSLSLQGLITIPHIRKGYYNISGIIPSSGEVVNGYRKNPSKTRLNRFKEICFSIRRILETIEEAGYEISSIRLCGGQALQSDLSQLKADILHRPILLPRIYDAELLGSAIIAFQSLGIISSIIDSAKNLVHITQIVHPRSTTGDEYDTLYEEWKRSQ